MQETPKNEKGIEQLKYPTKKEEFLIRSKKTLKRIFAAYGASAILGIAGGKGVQNVTRDITGFDEATRAKYEKLLDKEKQKENTVKVEEDKSFLRKWADKISNTTKEIANGEMLDEIKLNYYKILNLIDDTAFLVPAILIFLMMGRYANRMLKRVNGGDPVQKKKEELVLNKINEIVNKLNSYDLNNMNQAQQQEAKNLLTENKDLFNDIH